MHPFQYIRYKLVSAEPFHPVLILNGHFIVDNNKGHMGNFAARVQEGAIFLAVVGVVLHPTGHWQQGRDPGQQLLVDDNETMHTVGNVCPVVEVLWGYLFWLCECTGKQGNEQ